MTWTLTSTADPTNSPPRVLLEATEDDPLISVQSVTLFRDGLPLRFEPVISASSAIAYDYDAPFDVSLLYRADAVGVDVSPEWTETWGTPGTPPTGWTGGGWSAASGVASSDEPNAIIYRDTTTAITSVDVTAPSNMILGLADAADSVLAYVQVTPDGMVTVAGTSGAAVSVVGSGDYVVSVAGSSMSVEGTGWEAEVPFSGVATRVMLGSLPAANYVTGYGSTGAGVGQAGYGRGIAFNTAGTDFFVADLRGKILKFTAAGVYVSEFGTSGTGVGQLDSPYGIEVDAADNIWVADLTRHKILKYDSAGVFQAEYGTFGTGNGQFNTPVDIAFKSTGNLVVTDYGNNRVQEFNAAGVYQSQFAVAGGPNGIAVGAADSMFVTRWDADLVTEYNSAGVSQGDFGYGFDHPNFVVVDAAGVAYVTDWGNDRFVIFDTATADLIGTFGAAGSGPGQFALQPQGIDVLTSGDIYVINPGGSVPLIQRWTQDGGSVDDIVAVGTGRETSASASDTVTLSPTGDHAGAWLTNAAQPDLALIAEAEPASGDDPYFIVTSTRESGDLAANTAAIPIEGSADVVTAVLGPRLHETWALDIACTTQAAYKGLIALLADSAAINLRFPDTPRWVGLDGGFYAVGDVSTSRIGHPQLGPVLVVSLPLTPSRAPAYKPLWQWNMRTAAQAYATMAEANAAFSTMRAALVGPG